MDHEPSHDAHANHGGAEAGGLAVSAEGYTLELDTALLNSGRQTVRFRVNGPDGLPVTDFKTAHDKELHFIAVRRDTSGFQHVHPAMNESGTWSTELDLTPADWRFFADFHPAGHGSPITLGIDAAVSGMYAPQQFLAATSTAQVGDYTVNLAGELEPGHPSELVLTITRLGQPVTDLEPYLAAYGHLVALRVGDLGYLHVHPEGEPGDGITSAGPEIGFVATAPSPGTYRLFLDFQHAGEVHTAEFTLVATSFSTSPESFSHDGHENVSHHH